MQRIHYLGHIATYDNRRSFKRAIIATERLVQQNGDLAQPVLWTHEGADQDGIGAMKFLSEFLLAKGLRPRIVTGPVLFTARPLAATLGIDIDECNGDSQGMHFVLDTSARPLLNGALGNLKPLRTTVIDHHVQDATSIEARYRIINLRARSTCEILASLVLEDRIGEGGAFALAVGIASDSQRLSTAERHTILTYKRLLARAHVQNQNEVEELADPQWDARIRAVVARDLENISRGNYKRITYAIGLSNLETPFILADTLRRMEMDISAALCEIGTGMYKLSFRSGIANVHANEIARRTSELCEMPEEMH